MADVDITIQTKGNPQGLAQTEQALAEMREELARVRAELAKVATTEPQAAAAVKQFEDTLTEAEAGVSRAQSSLGRLQGGLGQTGKGSRNTGMAVLEFSRALEDAQYGVRGVLNNIPGLLSMLGAGAGLAGVVSIAAVALTVLVPKLLSLADATKSIELGELPQLERISSSAAVAADDAARAQESHNRALAAAEEAVKAYESALSQMVARTAAREDAQLGVQLAEIDLEVLRGNLTEAEAAVKRYDANRLAERRKRAMEEEALARTAQARQAQVAPASEDYRRSVDAEDKARMAANRVAESQPGDLPELRDQVNKRDEALRAVDNAYKEGAKKAGYGASEAEVNKAVNEIMEGKDGTPGIRENAEAAQRELKRAYDELVAARLAEYQAATEARVAAQERAKRLGAEAQGAQGELTRFRTEGTDLFAARDREAQLRATIAAEQDQQRRDREAAKAREEQEKAQLAAQRQADAAAAGAQSADYAGKGLANSGAELARRATLGGADPAAVAALAQAAQALGDGAGAGEGAALAAALNRLAEVLPQKLAAMEKQLRDGALAAEKLEGRLKAARSVDPGG